MWQRMSCVAAALMLCLSVARGEPATQSSAGPTTRPNSVHASPVTIGSAVIIGSEHRDDRGTYFTFARGIRGGREAGYRVGDVSFFNGTLETRKHTGDRSVIIDLGEKSWSQLDTLPPLHGGDTFSATATSGHAYLVHIDDTTQDFWAVMRVISVTPKERCEVEWLRLDTSVVPPPEINEDDATRIATLLAHQDDNIDPAMLLQQPKVTLQLRAGAGGGNPNTIDMGGNASIYVDRISPRPLDVTTPVGSHEDALAYVSGGRVPPGKCFVISHVSYQGSAKGDSNGHGEMIIRAGKYEIASKCDEKSAIKGEWNGWIEIWPGQENTLNIEVANSSIADVTFDGDLIDAAAMDAARPAKAKAQDTHSTQP